MEKIKNIDDLIYIDKVVTKLNIQLIYDLFCLFFWLNI